MILYKLTQNITLNIKKKYFFQNDLQLDLDNIYMTPPSALIGGWSESVETNFGNCLEPHPQTINLISFAIALPLA